MTPAATCAHATVSEGFVIVTSTVCIVISPKESQIYTNKLTTRGKLVVQLKLPSLLKGMLDRVIQNICCGDFCVMPNTVTQSGLVLFDYQPEIEKTNIVQNIVPDVGKTPKLPPCGAAVVVNIRFDVVDNPPFTPTNAERV